MEDFTSAKLDKKNRKHSFVILNGSAKHEVKNLIAEVFITLTDKLLFSHPLAICRHKEAMA
ncbi:MAG: hypothetical protein IJ278_02470 [Clostridia bacterium]|nr:hypothetical protein [Clostridia bacterium]